MVALYHIDSYGWHSLATPSSSRCHFFPKDGGCKWLHLKLNTRVDPAPGRRFLPAPLLLPARLTNYLKLKYLDFKIYDADDS
jgi:hypothetical protein